MTSLLITNTAVTICVGPFFDKTDGVTPETGLTVANCKITAIAETDENSAPTIILDNVAGNDATNTLAHITGDDAGYYSLKLTAANVNRLGRFKIAILDAANHCPVFHEYMIVTANYYNSICGTDIFDVSVTQLGGSAIDQSGGLINANVKQISGDAAAADTLESYCDGTTNIPANIKKINDVALVGDGSSTKFGV